MFLAKEYPAQNETAARNPPILRLWGNNTIPYAGTMEFYRDFQACERGSAKNGLQ